MSKLTEKVEKGQTVDIHYVGTFNDGEQFDSSHDREEVLSVQVGAGQLIKGFDAALIGMEIGVTKTVNIKPTEGYGEYNPEAVAELPKDMFPKEVQDNLVVGMILPLVLKHNPAQPFPAKTKEVKESTYVFDLNHPLAGKELNFSIDVLSIAETVEEPVPTATTEETDGVATEGTEG
jgi:FKBP-type peptidyl-prolyl cis-trans isomerase 2|tara:strand:- start:814 stop:1344 length:531 start_codon:yes stop_codon:yes gene_type:complete